MTEEAVPTCPVGGERPLTTGERALVRSVFGNAVNSDPVRIRRRRWHPLQPRHITMAPCGHIHFHPDSPAYREDFAQADLPSQGFFIHEMAHVWQAQKHGRLYLPIFRHPFCRYGYVLKPGWALERYGIEQQAEIIRHAFLLKHGLRPDRVTDPSAYAQLVDFPGAG